MNLFTMNNKSSGEYAAMYQLNLFKHLIMVSLSLLQVELPSPNGPMSCKISSNTISVANKRIIHYENLVPMTIQLQLAFKHNI